MEREGPMADRERQRTTTCRAEKGRLADKASQRPEEETENARREPLLVRVAAS